MCVFLSTNSIAFKPHLLSYQKIRKTTYFYRYHYPLKASRCPLINHFAIFQAISVKNEKVEYNEIDKIYRRIIMFSKPQAVTSKDIMISGMRLEAMPGVKVTTDLIEQVRRVYDAKLKADAASKAFFHKNAKDCDPAEEKRINSARDTADNEFLEVTEKLGVTLSYPSASSSYRPS